jgi:hypothetical protein
MSLALGANPTSVPHWVVEAIGAMYIDLTSGLALENPICEPIFLGDPRRSRYRNGLVRRLYASRLIET